MSARTLVLPHRKGKALAQGHTALGPEWNQTSKEAPVPYPQWQIMPAGSPTPPQEQGARLCTAEPWSCLQVVIWDPAVGDLHSWGFPVPWHSRGGAVLTATGGPSDGPAPELPSRAVSLPPATLSATFQSSSPALTLTSGSGPRERSAPAFTVASDCLLGPAGRPWPRFGAHSLRDPTHPSSDTTQSREASPLCQAGDSL